MERIRCPNPKCGRHILDIEQMPPDETVLEMKCRRCGEVVRVGILAVYMVIYGNYHCKDICTEPFR